MRVILVPVANRPECAKALAAAFELGRQLGANVIGCHMRAHKDSDIKLTTSVDKLAEQDAAWQALSGSKRSKAVQVAARSLFAEIAEHYDYPLIKKARATPGALWQEKVGSPDKLLAILGPVSDLIVVSRPNAKGGKLAQMFLQAALLSTSRPVLVLPQSKGARVGRRVSIAWNQSAEAAQAVAAALPLLQRAETVTIITCGSEGGVGPKSSQLAAYLQFWGVKTTRLATRGVDDAKAILKAHKESKSDLLVMGAYSRSRLRERVFGGVTEHMLYRANIPIFTLHT